MVIKIKRELSKQTEIERSIIKRYRKVIWNNFVGAVKEYELIKENDNIAVCISGGKDSMILAKCMQELHKHSEVPFNLKFIVMDPGYAEPNRKLIEENLDIMGIDAEIFESDIFDVAYSAGGSPCYLCARMRRGALYAKAKAIGCNKIALGHHFDDVIETLLMSMMYSSEIKTMLPKLHSTNFEGMELIRPLYCVREDDIKAFARYNSLEFLNCAGRVTEKLGEAGAIDREGISKRYKCKELIKELKKEDDLIDINIFRSFHRVNLDTIIGYHKKGDEHFFLDDYDEL